VTGGLLVPLLLASFLCVAAGGLAGALATGGRRRARLLEARIAQALEPYRLAPTGAAGAAGAAAGEARGGLQLQQRGSWARRAARLLRYDPALAATYKAPPPVVAGVALAIALGAGRAASELGGGLAWLLVPAAWLQLCRTFYGWSRNRLRSALYKQFPDALGTIVRAVRVGAPVVEAIRAVAREAPHPTAREFAAAAAQTGVGVPLEDALREMAARSGLPEYWFFATALSLQSQTGGGLTETLENLADTIRKRVAATVRGHAMAAEARTSSYVLGGLPIVTGVLLSVVNPGYMAVLFVDPGGRKLLMGAAGLLSVGAISMRVIIRKSLS
jgi:tight adherence protein B